MKDKNMSQVTLGKVLKVIKKMGYCSEIVAYKEGVLYDRYKRWFANEKHLDLIKKKNSPADLSFNLDSEVIFDGDRAELVAPEGQESWSLAFHHSVEIKMRAMMSCYS
jgi:hypothetical protein